MDKVGGGCSGASEPPCRGGQILRRLTTSWQGSDSSPSTLRSIWGPEVLCWFFLEFLPDGSSQHRFVPGRKKTIDFRRTV